MKAVAVIQPAKAASSKFTVVKPEGCLHFKIHTFGSPCLLRKSYFAVFLSYQSQGQGSQAVAVCGPRYDMICVTLDLYLHVVPVRKHTDMLELHVFRAKMCDKSDTSGHCLGFRVNSLYSILKHCKRKKLPTPGDMMMSIQQ